MLCVTHCNEKCLRKERCSVEPCTLAAVILHDILRSKFCELLLHVLPISVTVFGNSSTKTSSLGL